MEVIYLFRVANNDRRFLFVSSSGYLSPSNLTCARKVKHVNKNCHLRRYIGLRLPYSYNIWCHIRDNYCHVTAVFDRLLRLRLKSN